jgi:hypothetical protein
MLPVGVGALDCAVNDTTAVILFETWLEGLSAPVFVLETVFCEEVLLEALAQPDKDRETEGERDKVTHALTEQVRLGQEEDVTQVLTDRDAVRQNDEVTQALTDRDMLGQDELDGVAMLTVGKLDAVAADPVAVMLPETQTLLLLENVGDAVMDREIVLDTQELGVVLIETDKVGEIEGAVLPVATEREAELEGCAEIDGDTDMVAEQDTTVHWILRILGWTGWSGVVSCCEGL